MLAQIEKQTSTLRGLPFKKPVIYKSIGRDELKRFLHGKITEQYNSQEMRDYAARSKRLVCFRAGRI